MNWKNLGESLINVAPTIGGLLLGNVGAAGGMLLAQLFGTENTPEAIAQAIETDPKAIEKIQELEKTKFEEKAKTLRAMLEGEAISKHTTRPKIAYGAFLVVSFISIGIFVVWAVAALQGNTELVQTIQDYWPFVLGLIMPFVGWLNSYFGVLRDEQKDKLDAIYGRTSVPSTGVLQTLLRGLTLK